MKYDWQEVVDREPKGYVELNDGKQVIHGPLENIVIDENDSVVITLKWAAHTEIGHLGLPSGKWKVATEKKYFFPNLIVPFQIEDTPEKGPRVRFGLSIMYFNEQEGLDPSKVEGLVLGDGRLPFHEVLATKLADAPMRPFSEIKSALDAAQMMTILEVLARSKMPAAAAHKIAEDHANLPKKLADAGHIDLSKFAVQVLDDLRTREAEKDGQKMKVH